ncbi:MAG TPA: hypothetical protein VF179_05415, partial [Thermoanaerobaculia bacterium]|nr:hypothetical protein [Thermoanaerobaculia bacterium]
IIRQRAYEIPFPIEISFDAAPLQTYLPITGGPVRYDEIEFILPDGEIIYLREIIASLGCRLEEEQVTLPCRLSLELPEGARIKHPAGELYVPVRSASFFFVKLRFNESSRVDSPPETLGYVFSDILRGEINRIEPERVTSALRRHYEGNLAPGKGETTE